MTSLTDKVVATLLRDISDGTLQPGMRLPTENGLMRRFAVSRSVVREAISRMQAERIVETRHGVGSFVMTPAADVVQLDAPVRTTLVDAFAILEFRTEIESAAAAFAATRRTEAHLTQMARALEHFDSALRTGSTDVVAHDVAFHTAIAAASGNRYFLDVLQQMGRGVSPRSQLKAKEIAALDRVALLYEVLREHRMIEQAIVRRDADDARAAMRMHLAHSRERLRAASGLAQTY
ncbi:FCD domain-containing protein [Robbsia sp. KACC 23696]|uniref:FadR/GntR family transcriptional regulator n=1 Tax=Robbsia sp. KACC 23696 TaxID=3149231 RepID=UPI00325BD403